MGLFQVVIDLSNVRTSAVEICRCGKVDRDLMGVAIWRQLVVALLVEQLCRPFRHLGCTCGGADPELKIIVMKIFKYVRRRTCMRRTRRCFGVECENA